MTSPGAPCSLFDKDSEGVKLISANTKFALALYKMQAKEHPDGGNIFMSPLSISMALAMTYLGARGRTLSEMKAAMFLDDVSEAELHETFSALRLSLANQDQACHLHLANRLFGEKSYKFLDEYCQSTEKFYGTTLAKVDFM